jgi:hypothetical protein
MKRGGIESGREKRLNDLAGVAQNLFILTKHFLELQDPEF